MIKHKIDLIPIINKSYKVINYYTWEGLFNLKQKKKVFFNLGFNNRWKNLLNDDMRKKIENEFNSEMKELNYL